MTATNSQTDFSKSWNRLLHGIGWTRTALVLVAAFFIIESAAAAQEGAVVRIIFREVPSDVISSPLGVLFFLGILKVALLILATLFFLAGLSQVLPHAKPRRVLRIALVFAGVSGASLLFAVLSSTRLLSGALQYTPGLPLALDENRYSLAFLAAQLASGAALAFGSLALITSIRGVTPRRLRGLVEGGAVAWIAAIPLVTALAWTQLPLYFEALREYYRYWAGYGPNATPVSPTFGSAGIAGGLVGLAGTALLLLAYHATYNSIRSRDGATSTSVP